MDGGMEVWMNEGIDGWVEGWIMDGWREEGKRPLFPKKRDDKADSDRDGESWKMKKAIG
jgi:hypothetical protein